MPRALIAAPDHSHRHLPPGHLRRDRRPELDRIRRPEGPVSRSSSITSPVGTTGAPSLCRQGGHRDLLSHPGHALTRATRILFAMGRDGLLPPMFAKVDSRRMTPVNNTIVVMIAVSILAGVISLTSSPTWCRSAPRGLHRRLRRRDHSSSGNRICRARSKCPVAPRHPGPVRPGLSLHPVQPPLVHVGGVRLLGRCGVGVLLLRLGTTPQRAEHRRRSRLNDCGGTHHDDRRRLSGGQGGDSAAAPRGHGGRGLRTSPTVATVVPKPWTHTLPARIDAEYTAWADQLAADSATEAQRFRPVWLRSGNPSVMANPTPVGVRDSSKRSRNWALSCWFSDPRRRATRTGRGGFNR